jgi:hypothetical protein
MHRHRLLGLAVPLLVGVSVVGIGPAGAGPRPVKFEDARLKVEINATDGDAGLQIFLDGEPWNHVELLDTEGKAFVDFDVTGRAENFGLTELFSESSEPPFAEFPLAEFKRLFPEGTYRVRGTTVDGEPMTGTATLTHDFPDGPDILSPTDGSTVPADDVVVEWAPVTTPPGIDIAGYQVTVTQEKPVLRVFSVDLPATATRTSVPAEFVQGRIQYSVEVLAIEAGGNQTLTSVTFRSR